MTDPYRESARVPGCPMCGMPWDVSDLAATPCANGCGVWMTMAYLASIIDLRALVLESSPGWFYRGEPALDDRPLACPTCGETMKIVWAKKTPVHQCEVPHGLWIGAKERDAFSNELYEPIEQRQRIANMRQQLASVVAGIPGAVEQMADRILSLEDRITALERRRN
ncbi:MAG TPA: hypothetical protein VF403_16395 [Kofleriaceae bacterium]